jgi:phage tail sheath protein FI
MVFFHGIIVTEPTDGVTTTLEKSTAVIGLVATAGATDAETIAKLEEAFPLNRPVLVTDARAAAGLAGSTGTLAPALITIGKQGSPLVVVVRVAEGADAEATSANVIGGTTNGVYTGLQALLAAEGVLGVKPRILGAPGLDNLDVVQELVGIAKKLRGFVYASCAGAETRDAAVTYRKTFADRELMLMWPDGTAWDGQAIATALGLRAMLDEQVGWHQSLSNNVVAGITGITKDVHFDIRDMSTDAGVLNAAQVTTIVRPNGFRFWGNRTCSDEAAFAFEVSVRTSQAIQDVIADACAPYIDKPLTRGLVTFLVDKINGKLSDWTTNGRLIGARCWYDPASNPTANLTGGNLVLDYDYTPCAPLEGLQLNQRITDKYYAGFGDSLTV